MLHLLLAHMARTPLTECLDLISIAASCRGVLPVSALAAEKPIFQTAATLHSKTSTVMTAGRQQ